MAKPSSLKLAATKILTHFTKATQKIYSEPELAGVLEEKSRDWKVVKSTSVYDFISFLERQGDLKPHKFRSEEYGREFTRYAWGKVSTFELALSIKSRGYLCHGTAATVHGLTRTKPNTIYLNVEQSPKPLRPGLLTQSGLNLAFSREQRRSNLIYTLGDTSVTVIAGKNTNRLGVEKIVGPNNETIAVTNLERTLIDIVVRPAYAGGPLQVLRAYRAARDRVSIDLLMTLLKQLDYLYPYHQSIGFLMERSGYSEESCAKLRAHGLENDFYLAHGMQTTDYDKHWRLHYPKGLKG